MAMVNIIINNNKVVGYSDKPIKESKEIEVKDVEHFMKYFNFYNVDGTFNEKEITDYERTSNN